MKDETAGDGILAFADRRAKQYAYKARKVEKKCKGIKKCVIKQSITCEDYKKCLCGGQDQRRTTNITQSKKHQIYAQTVDKVALSRDDDKREINGGWRSHLGPWTLAFRNIRR